VYQEIETNITLFEAQRFSAAVFPTKVGNTAGQAGVDLIWINILNLTSGTWKSVNYEWSGYTFPGNDLGVNISRVFYLLFDLVPNEWNVIERNLYDDYSAFYGTPENTSELVVNRISLLSHSSNGDPGDFYVDDLYIGILDVLPEIDSPADIEYEAGTVGNFIQWNPDSDVPSIFNITQDSILISSGDWNGSSIIFDVDGLEPGTYEFILTVEDDYGRAISDSVLVTVVDTTDPILNKPDHVILNVGDEANITWIAVDLYPESYHVLMNGTEFASGLWNSTGEEIVIDLESLEPGVYEFMILVSDSYGNEATDVVLVVVLPSAFQMDISTLIIIFGGISVIVIVIVIIRSKS
jgi:hypothetical protein